MIVIMIKRETGARVRGECKNGHVTELMAPSGRITWSGACSAEGCELPVKCKRIPGGVAAGTTEGERSGASRVKKVSGYVRRKRTNVGRSDKRDPVGGLAASGPGEQISEPGFVKARARPVEHRDEWGFFPGFH